MALQDGVLALPEISDGGSESGFGVFWVDTSTGLAMFTDSSDTDYTLAGIPAAGLTDSEIVTADGTNGLQTETGITIDASGNISEVTQILIANAGLRIRDNSDSYYLRIQPNSNLTADRTLTVTTGDSNRTITLSGDPTLSDWFNQDVQTSATPTFASLTLTNTNGLYIYDDCQLRFGNNSDVLMKYDEAGDDRFEITGTASWYFDSIAIGIDGHVSIYDDNELRLYDSGSSHYISQSAPALTANEDYIWPAAADANKYLKVAADGTMSWDTPAGGGTHYQFFSQTTVNNNEGDFSTNAALVGNATNDSINFYVHGGASSCDDVFLVAIGTATNASSDIDLTSDYSTTGEAYATHSESDNASTYAITSGNMHFLSIKSAVFNSLAPGDVAAVNIDDNTGCIEAVGILVEYTI